MARVQIGGGAEIAIYSFGRNGKEAPNCQYVIDVSGLRDPQSNRGFKKRYADGRAGEIQDFVKEDSRMEAILDNVKLLAHMQLRSQGRGPDRWISIAFKDHHGTWISPAVAEIVADALSKDGYNVGTFHFGLGVSL